MTLLRRAFLPSTADLLAFEAAARHQSVSRAAEELHLTQSAVSRQIRQLEEQIGTALFHRVRQRVVLTDAGRVYAADVQNVLQQLSASTQKAMAFSSTDGLLNLLDGRELAGVLAHEIGHIANRELWIMSLADMMSRLVSLTSWLGQLLLLLNLPLVLAGFVHGDLACRDSSSRPPSWRWSNSAFRARASKTPTAPQQI